MVPKEGGFNQSKTSCALCVAHCDVLQARPPRQDSEVLQRHHWPFLSSWRHILPSKVRLRNNQTARNVSTLIWPRKSLASSCQSTEMVTLLNSIYFVFRISFLPKYRVIYYDYTVNWCSLINCNLCVYCWILWNFGFKECEQPTNHVTHCLRLACVMLRAKFKAKSSDTHQFQATALHHFTI